jgi:hypothetical protein
VIPTFKLLTTPQDDPALENQRGQSLLIRQLNMHKVQNIFGVARPMHLRSWGTLKAVPMSLRSTGLASPDHLEKITHI